MPDYASKENCWRALFELDSQRGTEYWEAVSSADKTSTRDRALRAALAERVPQHSTRLRMAVDLPSGALRRCLSRQLSCLRFESHWWTDTDGERARVTIVRATDTSMWPMGTHYWIRDNAFVAARLLFSPLEAEHRQRARVRGRQLLLSAVRLMSSCKQLARFETILRSRSWRQCCEQDRWPHIFFSIEQNLNAGLDERWSHKQDAWQILAWYLLKALEKRWIRLGDLSSKQRQFLGFIVPFLAKVQYFRQENSGSWEEIPALRSSVLCWEVRLIEALARLATVRGFEFLEAHFLRYRRFLSSAFRQRSFARSCAVLLRAGVSALQVQIPFESPSYAEGDPRFREADAALVYLLEAEIPQFLGKYLHLKTAEVSAMELRIVKLILSLSDPLTGGIRRYNGDSYQRQGFFRYRTCARLDDLYGAPSGDSSTHFVARDAIVPRGRSAAWVHPVWQLCAWSAQKYMKTKDAEYLHLQRLLLRRGWNLFTSKGSVSIERNRAQELVIKRIPTGLVPECWLTETAAGRRLLFPSPHTPMNWAVAEAVSALAWSLALKTNTHPLQSA